VLIPIRLKILGSVLLLLMLSVGLITATMARLFHADKTTYVKDLAAVTASSTKSEIDTLLERYAGAAYACSEVIGADYLSETQKQRMAATLFAATPSLLAVTTLGADGAPATLFDANALAAAGLTSEQVAIKDLTPWRGGTVRSLIWRIEADQAEKALLVRIVLGGRSDKGSQPVVATLRGEVLRAALRRVDSFQVTLVNAADRIVVANDATRSGAAANSRPAAPGAHSLWVGEERLNGQTYFVGSASSAVAPAMLVVRVPQAAAFLTAQDLVRQLIWLGFALVVAAAVLGIVMARRLSRPLENLSSAAETVGAGRFDVTVAVSSHDEVGLLAKSFNTMTENLRERDARLCDANRALIQSEKMAALGQLSAGLAHEVKNPLAGILGFAQLSRRKLDDPAALSANLDVIERETRRCTEIIASLMRFSRQEPAQFAATDLNDVTRRAIAIVDHQLSLKKVKVEIDCAPGLPLVNGNGNQLQQVLINLLLNAQQAMEPQGGTVRIRTWSVDAAVMISVKDDGPGIAEQHLPRIFEPFFTTKQAGQGTGLGLSVTYGIIRDHGGEISAESPPGQGAVFTIRLPVCADSGATGNAESQSRSEAA
jgi:two-component system, NtrC family, sensor kinase